MVEEKKLGFWQENKRFYIVTVILKQYHIPYSINKHKLTNYGCYEWEELQYQEEN